jgi:hypothetical protein
MLLEPHRQSIDTRCLEIGGLLASIVQSVSNNTSRLSEQPYLQIYPKFVEIRDLQAEVAKNPMNPDVQDKRVRSAILKEEVA